MKQQDSLCTTYFLLRVVCVAKAWRCNVIKYSTPLAFWKSKIGGTCSCALIMTERFGFGAQKSKLIRTTIIELLHQFQGWNFSKDVSLSSSWKGYGHFHGWSYGLHVGQLRRNIKTDRKLCSLWLYLFIFPLLSCCRFYETLLWCINCCNLPNFEIHFALNKFLQKEQWFIEGCSQQGIMWDVSVVGKVQYDAGSHGPSFSWSVRKF